MLLSIITWTSGFSFLVHDILEVITKLPVDILVIPLVLLLHRVLQVGQCQCSTLKGGLYVLS